MGYQYISPSCDIQANMWIIFLQCGFLPAAVRLMHNCFNQVVRSPQLGYEAWSTKVYKAI